MIKYTPSNQLTLEAFQHPFAQELDPDNRWVRLAELVPWDELAGIYAKNLDPGTGRLSVDIRMVIGALIIKHMLCLDDRDTVSMISKNLYMQYSCGLKSFQRKNRKRMGADKIDQFNETVIHRVESLKPKRKRIMKDTPGEDQDNKDDPGGQQADAKENTGSSSKKESYNQGSLKLDASVADQYITYTTDMKLLNTAREETERLIDILYKKGSFEKKPRTYRRNARKEYLVVSKKRRKSKKGLSVVTGKQLRYVKRNISTIEKMLDELELVQKEFPLKHRDQKIYWVVQHLYDQQMYMYRNKVHKCSDRIVNIYQPYVRPMVRGKDRVNVEFVAKINISEVDGIVRCNHIGWDNYDEEGDREKQVEDF